MAGVQDFTQVVIGNRKVGTVKAGTLGSAASKKGSGAAGISSKLDNSDAHKLDNNEVKPPETMGKEVGKHIAKGRLAKGWKTQDEFARQLALTKNVIAELENGTHKHDNKLLQKVENKLGVWLTGDVERHGQPKVKEFGKKATNAKANAGKSNVEDKKGSTAKDKNDLKSHSAKTMAETDSRTDATATEAKAGEGSDKENA